MVMGWFEMTEEDRPERSIWLDDEALEEHFERVNDRYKTKRGSEPIPEFDEPNQLTKDIRKGKR